MRCDPERPLTALGLDSLSALELSYRLESRFGFTPPLAALLGGASLADLAAEISAWRGPGEQRVPEETAAPSPAVTAAAAPSLGHAAAALSPGQQALWFLERLVPEAIHNIAVAARVQGLDQAALRRALAAATARHPALRSSLTAQAAGPALRVEQEVEVDLVEQDAAAWSPRRLQAALEEEAHRRFDLARHPLLRLRLFRLSSTEHAIVLVIHHVISDYWSLAVLARDLSLLYRQETGGTTALLEPVRLTFADWVSDQHAMLAGAEGERLWAYWRRRLAGPPPDLDLPGDRPHPAAPSYRGGVRWTRYPGALAERLHALGRSADATIFMALLAAWQVQLGRYTRQEDFVVGSPSSGRGAPAAANVVGYFVNPVALRADLSGNPGFAELLQRVRQTVLEAVAHADYPFALIAQHLRPARDRVRPPIFQTTFGLVTRRPTEPAGLPAFSLGVGETRLELGGLSLQSVELGERRTQFDLAVRMAPAEEPAGGLVALLEYNADLFDGATAARMLGHFGALLEAAVAEPQRRLAALPLLTAAERSQVVREWNDTVAGTPEKVFFHQAFARQAERAPDAPAILCGAQRISFGQLDREADQLARFLASLGVGPEVLVAVALEICPDLVRAMLAIWKAGGVYLPLDPGYPAQRLAFMLEDSAAPVLLTHEPILDLLPTFPGFVIRLDQDWTWIADQSAAPLAAELQPDNLAYVIYTSGSTGAPKAAQLTHRGLSNLDAAERAAFAVAPEARVLEFASPSFDASIFEMVMALGAGAALCLAPRDARLGGQALADLLRQQRITHVTLPPTSLQALPAEPFPLLQSIVVAGEACPAELVERWCGGREFWNAYGPTEATVWATLGRCGGGDRKPSIGRPIVNTEARVLGPQLEPVPVGIAGELCLGGAGLARGYLGRPALTAETFVPHPLAAQPGLRLYRTGDLVRYRPDGSLEFLDRLDRQVKLRGFRIELGEIEAVLRGHGAVAEAAVTAWQDRRGETRLVAYLVPREPEALAPEELRGYLRAKLPDFMVPASYVALPSLPRTASGKLDRRALPAPDDRQASSGEPCRPARTPIEELVATIWCDVLDREHVAAGESFFDVGGHSLLATQVVSRLSSALAVELPLSDLFEAATVEGLARRLEERLRGDSGLAAPPIEREEDGIAPPLSFAQQRLWFIDQLEPDNPAYVIPVAIRIAGPLDPAVLAACMSEISRRHAALRTRFELIQGEPRQVIGPPVPPALPLVDLGGLAGGEPEARRLAAAEARRPFKLAVGPLLRSTLLRLGPLDHVALFTLHHIVADGWSLGILLRELSLLYSALLESRPPALPELPIQYSDFAWWQRRWLRGRALETYLAYWRQKLAGELTVLALPLDRERRPLPTYRGRDHCFVVPPDLRQAIKALGQKEGTTLFMTMLAAFKALLYRYSGQTDLVVGTVVANRSRAETERLIGCFINTLVLRTGLAGDMTFRDLLHRVRETAVGAYTHQDLPFERLVEELAPERDLSRFPLFQVRLTLEHDLLPKAMMPGLELRPFSVTQGVTKFDLTLAMVESGDELAGTVTYRTELFDAATIELFCERYLEVLGAVTARPTLTLADLELDASRGFTPVSLEASRGRFQAARPLAVPLGHSDVAPGQPTADRNPEIRG